MKVKYKEKFIYESVKLKQSIKASYSEIMKDLLQLEEGCIENKKDLMYEIVKKKIPKHYDKKKNRKYKMKITEDISPVLGLASLINEIDTDQTCKKKLAKQPKNKNSQKTNKKSIRSLYTNAEVHIGIAKFITTVKK